MQSPVVVVNAVRQVAPLELLAVPRELDGSRGSNREWDVPRQIGADTDVEAIRAWLTNFADRRATFDAYRKEAERLLLWSVWQLGKPLSSLTHEDWLAYLAFLAAPCPPERWMSDGGRKHPRGDARWRPFAGPLSASSQRQASVILNSMFSWLVNAGYLAGNPLSLSRQRKRRPAPRIVRYLEEGPWLEVKAAINALPRETSREREHYYRLRWLITLCYICGLRISEIAANSMGHFFCRRDQAGNERWWLEVLGKGNKVRIVPATSELMEELGNYRRTLSYPALPVSGESTPLLLPIGGRPRPLSRGGIHDIIKGVFEMTAERVRLKGPEHQHEAARILQASAHWLRHTAGSHMANHDLDLRHVRDNLGHESISTTNTYLHASDDARHAETESKHRANW
ncbi:tyrosine-type recombinase/integrase [Massilia niastensis]|uniref:tyrosine-type recombinase/integrase n=1 Tax=Massilia niastensis TaxID=544911 RepID=UPI00036D365C|nr:tyrosine-type recombinase/integrase [Massilia niastensis]